MPTQNFKKDALLELQKSALRQIKHQLTDNEKILCEYLIACPSTEFEQVTQDFLNMKAKMFVRGYTLPKKWEPKPGILGIGKRKGSALYLTLKSLKNNEAFTKTILKATAFIDEVQALLSQDVSLTKLRELLFKSEWHDQRPFSEIDNWLRYHIVRIFHDMQGNDLNINLFKNALQQINNDTDGVEKALCDDYIYRRAFPFLQEVSATKEEKISTDMLEGPVNDVLMRKVTIPLLHEQVPYLEKRYDNVCMLTDAERNIGESKEDYADRFSEIRQHANGIIKSILKNRIEELGISEQLSALSFEEFYQEKQQRLPANNIAQPVIEEKKQVLRENKPDHFKIISMISNAIARFCSKITKYDREQPEEVLPETKPKSDHSKRHSCLDAFYRRQKVHPEALELKTIVGTSNSESRTVFQSHSSQVITPNMLRI